MTRDELRDAATELISAAMHHDVDAVRSTVEPLTATEAKLLAARLASVCADMLDDLALVHHDPLYPTAADLWQRWLLRRAAAKTGGHDG